MPDQVEPRERVRVFHPSGGQLMVKRAEQAASDINVIMRRWKSSGVAPVMTATPQYGDFSSGVDYHSGVNALLAAEKDFAALPSEVRKRVDNDPGQFLDMVADPDGLTELIDLGLAVDRIPDPKPPVEPEAPVEPPIVGGE